MMSVSSSGPRSWRGGEGPALPPPSLAAGCFAASSAASSEVPSVAPNERLSWACSGTPTVSSITVRALKSQMPRESVREALREDVREACREARSEASRASRHTAFRAHADQTAFKVGCAGQSLPTRDDGFMGDGAPRIRLRGKGMGACAKHFIIGGGAGLVGRGGVVVR